MSSAIREEGIRPGYPSELFLELWRPAKNEFYSEEDKDGVGKK